jgi:hypothetical protein
VVRLDGQRALRVPLAGLRVPVEPERDLREQQVRVREVGSSARARCACRLACANASAGGMAKTKPSPK